MKFQNLSARKSVCLMIVVLMMVPLISSCITSFNPKKTMVRAVDFIKPSYTQYGKKVCITQFDNNTRFKDPAFITLINQNLIDILKKEYPKVIIWEETENCFSDLKNRFPLLPTGKIDNLALSQRGRQLDLNAIILGNITDIRGIEEKKGFWFLRKPVQYIDVHIMVTVYDTQTGGKLLEEWVSKKIKVDKQVLDKFNATPSELPVPVVEEALTSLIQKVGDNIGYMLKHQPFKAYIKSISNNRITLGAGKNNGIAPEDVFDIFNSSEIVAGKNGHKFILSGSKTGMIKISEVLPDTSVGLIVDGKVEDIASCLVSRD